MSVPHRTPEERATALGRKFSNEWQLTTEESERLVAEVLEAIRTAESEAFRRGYEKAREEAVKAEMPQKSKDDSFGDARFLLARLDEFASRDQREGRIHVVSSMLQAYWRKSREEIRALEPKP